MLKEIRREIKEPVFTDGKCTGTTVKINKKGISGEKAVLKVTLIDNNGQEISVSRIVKFLVWVFDGLPEWE